MLPTILPQVVRGGRESRSDPKHATVRNERARGASESEPPRLARPTTQTNGPTTARGNGAFMRHLLSVVLAIVLTPLTYVAAGLAAVKLDAADFGGTINWTAAGIGIGAGVAAGAFYAILIMPPRLSPVGPIIAGLAFLGVTGWY